MAVSWLNQSTFATGTVAFGGKVPSTCEPGELSEILMKEFSSECGVLNFFFTQNPTVFLEVLFKETKHQNPTVFLGLVFLSP